MFENRRRKHLSSQKEQRKDRRKRPIVTDATQEKIWLEVLIVPPQFEIGFPKAWRVVELAQPPAANRNERDDHDLRSIGHQQRSPFQLINQRVGEKNVASPDDRREPMADELVAAKQQYLGKKHDRDSNVSVRRESPFTAGSVHRS